MSRLLALSKKNLDKINQPHTALNSFQSLTKNLKSWFLYLVIIGWIHIQEWIQIRSSVCADPPFFQIKNMGYKIFKGLDHLLTYIKKKGGLFIWSKFWDLGFPLCTRKKWLIFSIQFITCYYILIHFCKKFQNSTFHPKGGYWVRIQILMYPYSITTYYICVMNIWDRTYKIYLSYNNIIIYK